MRLEKSASRRVLAVATATLMGAGMVSAASLPVYASSLHAAAASLPELVMESSPETAITQDFNPFVPSGTPYAMGATGLIYEPLIEFDLAAPPKYYSWLATGYSWSNGGKSITFNIRTGVKWNDGVPFTPADVAFTFDLMKKDVAINLGGLNIKSATSSGNTVTVNFASPQYTQLENIAGTAIVPEHIWSNVGNPALYVDANPVGTGPYELADFTTEGFTLKVNPGYWQKSMEPKVPDVFFPVYESNTAALTALFSGQIDWTGNFIPGLQKNFVAKNPAEHGFWEAPGATNMFEPNLTKWPTNQLAVRQAISLAINRTAIADEGEAGLEYPVLNATGITLPTFAAWAGPLKSYTLSPVSQTAAAKAVLVKAGYTLKGGFFYLGSKEVTVTCIAPSAFTDYAEDCSLLAGELNAAGIKASFDPLSTNAWFADLGDGDFGLSPHWTNNGITPFAEYNAWLNSSLDASTATGDYERLNNPTIDADLAKLAGAQTTAEQTADLAPIGEYIAKNAVLIPFTTASEWFEYNSDHYTGWPTQANPYETGQPSGTNNGPGSGTNLVVILHLSPRM